MLIMFMYQIKTNTIKKNRETTLGDRKEVGIEINAKNTKYFMYHHRDARQNNNNNNNNKANKATENAAKLKYFEKDRNINQKYHIHNMSL